MFEDEYRTNGQGIRRSRRKGEDGLKSSTGRRIPHTQREEKHKVFKFLMTLNVNVAVFRGRKAT
jgi:hypothetical protein